MVVDEVPKVGIGAMAVAPAPKENEGGAVTPPPNEKGASVVRVVAPPPNEKGAGVAGVETPLPPNEKSAFVIGDGAKLKLDAGVSGGGTSPPKPPPKPPPKLVGGTGGVRRIGRENCVAHFT